MSDLPRPKDIVVPLPRAWRDFMQYCRDLGHGELERVVIQDGLPVLAEVTKKKVRFAREKDHD